MRSCHRNKQTIYYSLYVGEAPVIDSDGYDTGVKILTYQSPVKARYNVSAARGNAEYDMFGIDTSYTKTITTTNINCPIQEDSILWIGIIPDANGENGSVKHNYKVVAVARSINSVTYAIREVENGSTS